ATAKPTVGRCRTTAEGLTTDQSRRTIVDQLLTPCLRTEGDRRTVPRQLTVAPVPCHTAKVRRDQCPLTVEAGLLPMVAAVAPQVEAEAAFLPHPVMAAEAVEET